MVEYMSMYADAMYPDARFLRQTISSQGSVYDTASAGIPPWSISDSLSLITIISAPMVALPMLGASGILQAMPSPIATQTVITAGAVYGWPFVCLAGGACVVLWMGVNYLAPRVRWLARRGQAKA